MPFLFKYFWALAVLVNIVNGAIWWYRGKSHRERDPSLVDGYRSLITGFVGWGSIPWFVMGAGMIFGGVRSPFAYLDVRSPNLFVRAFFLTVFVLWGLSIYWLFARGGAEKLVRHPGLLQPNMTNPTVIKLCFLGALAGGVAFVLLSLSGWLKIPPGF